MTLSPTLKSWFPRRRFFCLRGMVFLCTLQCILGEDWSPGLGTPKKNPGRWGHFATVVGDKGRGGDAVGAGL